MPPATRGNLDSRGQTQEQLLRAFTFSQRAAYQYAIEEVYCRHRIWPRNGGENPGPKPLLDAIVSQHQIEHKVEEYLRKSQLVADQRGWPISGSELQTEMERMATSTRQPKVLGELFKALGNDSLVIAECLVRPILTERLVRECEGESSSPLRDGKPNREAITNYWPSAPATIARGAPKAFASRTADPPDAAYKLPEISSLECADRWTPTTILNAPVARFGHTAVWTGSEMIVWGGFDGINMDLNTGAMYEPATDSWTATSIANAPDVRFLFSAVWTGIEMIVWGGGNFDNLLSTGGRYNPIADTWTATSMVNVPIARNYHTAVWTGSEMIVWGGRGCGGNCILNTGGRYNPETDNWAATSIVNAPVARDRHNALWTGSEMIIWGGSDRHNYLHTGARYNPNTDGWTPTGFMNVPPGRFAHAAVWTGDEMIVWGGVDETFNPTNTGGRYNPGTDSWILTNIVNAPSPRADQTGVWTGIEMIVWGGDDTTGDFNTGGRYNAGTDSWTSTTTANAPLARDSHTAVWTGSEMIIWGGFGPSSVLDTGAIYCAQPTPTSTPSPTATPTATPNPTPSPSPTPTPTPTSGVTPTPTPTGTPTPMTHAQNLSTRLLVGTGNNVAIGGFITIGSASKHILLRGIGPSLSGTGVNALPDPVLELHGPGGFQTITNNNWRDTQEAEIIATGIPPANDLESAIVADLDPGAYTAILKGNEDTTGVGLVEIYDLTAGTAARLGNISTRALVNTGNDIVIAGFILGGGTNNDLVILRGLGPSLPGSLAPLLADPTLELRDSSGTLVAFNDNWMDDPAQPPIIIGVGLGPPNPLESCIAVSLAPGAYTALLAGKNGGTGLGLVEVYDNPAPAGPTPTPGGSATPTPGGSATPSPTPTSTPTPTPGSTPSPTPGTCTENFDGVTAPALPNGWIASNPIPGDGVMFVTSTVTPDSAPNDAYIPDQDGISDKVLDRGNVIVVSPSATLSFRNNFNSGPKTDGGVLEVSTASISNGDFLDITDPQIGGTFLAGGYTGEISSIGNPLAGRMAWTGDSGGYVNTVVQLGPNLNGLTVTLRWRFGSSEAVAAPGWRIDNLSIAGASCP